MTITSQVNKVSYTGTGSQTEFPVTYRFLEDGDLSVTVDGIEQTITTDYTVSGAGDESGGLVTFLTAPDADTTVTIKNAPPFTQETDYVENDPFPAESHEDALDKLTVIVQNIDEQVSRSFKLGVDSELEVTITPPVAENVGKSFKVTSLDDDDLTIGYTEQAVDDIPVAKVLASASDHDEAGYLLDKLREGNAISIGAGATPPGDPAYKVFIQVETKPGGGIGIDSGGAGLELDDLPSAVRTFYKIDTGEDPGHTHTGTSAPGDRKVSTNDSDTVAAFLSDKIVGAAGGGIDVGTVSDVDLGIQVDIGLNDSTKDTLYKVTSGEDPGHTHTASSLPPLSLVSSNFLDSSPGTLNEKLSVGNGIAKIADDTEVTINVRIVTDKGLEFFAGGLQLTDEVLQAVSDSGKVLTNASDSTIKYLEDAVGGSNGILVETDGLLGSNFLIVKPSMELLKLVGPYSFQKILNTVPPLYSIDFFDAVTETNGVPTGWTFASPGGGSYVDAAGATQTAGVNEIRHDWTAAGQYRGIKLVETEDTSLIYPTSNLLAFNADEGSVYIEVDAETDPAFALSANLSADASNERIRIFIDPEFSAGKDRVNMEVKVGGVTQASINVEVDSTEIYKIAAGWKADEFHLCVNGVSESDFSGSVPSINRFVLAGSSSTVQGDQRIARFSYFARNLGASTLCSITKA